MLKASQLLSTTWWTSTLPTSRRHCRRGCNTLHLGLLFPNQTTSLDWELSQTLAVVPDGAREKAGVAFGEAVADAPTPLRAEDGWDAPVTYTGATEPEWRPAPTPLPALSPQWGSVTPFALVSGDQFRPEGRPTSRAPSTRRRSWMRRLGSATSPERTGVDRDRPILAGVPANHHPGPLEPDRNRDSRGERSERQGQRAPAH